MGAELFHADRQTDTHTHIHTHTHRDEHNELIVAFRNFANSPGNQEDTLSDLN